MSVDTLPVIGAALPVSALATHSKWLLEKQRDLELQGFHDANLLNGDWHNAVDEAKKQLAGYSGRLGIHGPFWGFSLASVDPDVQSLVAKRLDQGLNVCAALEATHMVIHSPITTWDYNNLNNYDNAWEFIQSNLHATISAAVTRAADQGVVMVMENIEDINPQHRLELVKSFNSESLKVSLDTGHAHYAHGSNGAPPVDYFVKEAGDFLQHVHLQDADGYADRHWAIGEGSIHWAAVFRALSLIQCNPRLVLELRDHHNIAKSMDYLVSAGLAQ